MCGLLRNCHTGSLGGGGGKGEKMKGKEKGIKKGNRVWKEENTMRKRRGK